MPFYRRRRGFKSKPKTRKTLVKKAIKAAEEKEFNRKVQKVLNRNAEDKQGYKQAPTVAFNSAINAAGDAQYVLPTMAQGTDEGDRVGEQIRVKRLNVRGHFVTNLTYTSYSSVRIGVRMMMIQCKLYPSYTAANANYTQWQGSLLKKGDTVSAFNGDVSDLYAPINEELFTVYHDKIFYVQGPYVPVSNATGEMSGSQETTRFFDFSIPLRNKLLHYDYTEQAGLLPTNWCPIMVLGYSKLDGGTADTVNTAVSMSYVSTLTYQDL